MHAVVAQLAGAPMPEPVPVIVKDVVAEGSLRRRALPQGIVEPIRDRDCFAMPDRTAMVRVPGPREKYFPDLPAVYRANRLDHPRPTPPLVAHLNDAFVFARCCNQQFAFMQIMTARLFHIDMLARRASQDGGGRVPMIGGGN